jgi:hypothetical protein
LMNPIYWLFARIYHYGHTLLPQAIVEQLPVATVFVLSGWLLFPLIQVVLLLEMVLNVQIGTGGTVVLWLLLSALLHYLLVDKQRVSHILHRYPVNPTSKGRARAFFGLLVFIALFLSLFPIARFLQLGIVF